MYDELLGRLKAAYERIAVGNPLDPGTLVGPLIDAGALERMQGALERAVAEGGRVFGGERVVVEGHVDACYVRPAIVEMPGQTALVREETFAPILYVMRYGDLAEAIRHHNDVPQGLASSIFTTDVREAELFMSAEGSDCGIVNVNAGPSGAEIGGPSAARRKQAGAANPVPTPGRPTCAAPPTPSTTAASCRWRRASNSTEPIAPQGPPAWRPHPRASAPTARPPGRSAGRRA